MRSLGSMASPERSSTTENIYQDPTRSEAVYDSLQVQHPVKSNRVARLFSTRRDARILVISLCTVNTLILAIILLIVGLHYSQFQAGCDQAFSGKEEGAWHLHDSVFYLFWHEHGDCRDAERFCSLRNAALATAHQRNTDWIISSAHGKPLWVKADTDYDMYSSGDFPDQETCSCQLLGDPEVGTGAKCEDLHHWVCERAAAS